jgi:cytochrome c oxidase subunit 3
VKRRVLDVRGLPTIGFGPQEPLWWGMLMLNVIEGSMLALLAVAYVYVGDRTAPWPPMVSPRWIGWLATVELGLLIASVLPIWACGRASIRADLRAMRRWLIIGTALGVVALVVRWQIFEALPFRWDDNAYGSVVWTMLGLQTFHLLSSVVENGLFVGLLFRGPVEEKHRSDLHATTLLWYLVVGGATLQWSLIFVDILRTGLR